MMSFTVVALLAILLSFALYRFFGMNPSSTPVVSISIICDITLVFAMFGRLRLGSLIALGVCLLAFIASLFIKKEDRPARSFFTASIVGMLVCAFVMAYILHSRMPMINWWDEFSFWGMSAKLVKERGRLYTFYRSSMVGASTPPALPILTYIFHITSASYVEWLQFAAYDFLILACICSIAGIYDKKEGHMGVVVLVTGFMTVFMFRATGRVSSVSPAYITAYSEIPLAMLFARSVATCICNQEHGPKGILASAPVLSMLVFTKDMGFALGLIAVFIVACELLATRITTGQNGYSRPFEKIIYSALLAMVVVRSFFSWSFHMAKVMARDPFELGGETNYSMVQLMMTGVRELFGFADPSDKFIRIRNEMFNALFRYRISLIGSCAVLIAFISILFLLAYITADKRNRKSIASIYTTSLIGFAAYYVFHLFIYVYIFKDNAYGLVSYDRYMQIYFVGWLMISVLCLSLSSASEGRRGRAARWMSVVLRTFVTLVSTYYLSFDNTFLKRDRLAFSNRLNVSEKLEKIRDVIGEDDVIAVFTNDDGGKWFIYAFELSDHYVIPDSGLLAPSEEEPADRIKETFDRYGVTHVLLDNSSKELEDLYGDLFDTQIGHIGLDAVGYYRVIRDDDGNIHIESVKEVLSLAEQN